MSLLGSSRMENHPDGTGNINSILNGNWGILNNAINPAYGLIASQSLFAVTASAAVFVADMVGATIKWDDGHSAVITVVTDSTHVTVGTSQTVAATTFDVYRADVVQTPYSIFARGLLKRARMLSGDDNATIRWSNALNRFILVPAFLSIAPTLIAGSNYTLNLDCAAEAMTGTTMVSGTINMAFTTTNLTAGATKTVLMQKLSTGNATFSFPGWLFVGSSAPTTLAAGKVALLKLYASNTVDGGVLATYAVQP